MPIILGASSVHKSSAGLDVGNPCSNAYMSLSNQPASMECCKTPCMLKR